MLLRDSTFSVEVCLTEVFLRVANCLLNAIKLK